jgi:hypothetical protein
MREYITWIVSALRELDWHTKNGTIQAAWRTVTAARCWMQPAYLNVILTTFLHNNPPGPHHQMRPILLMRGF